MGALEICFSSKRSVDYLKTYFVEPKSLQNTASEFYVNLVILIK